MERSLTVTLLQSEMTVAPQGSLCDRDVSLTDFFKLSLAFSVEGQAILQILVT
jgi:hypothetical protein